MNASLKMYPVLNENIIDASGFSAEKTEISYPDDNGRCELELRDQEGDDFTFTAIVSDPLCSWYPETHELQLKQLIHFNNPAAFYGKDGIASNNSVLGVALHWSSIGSEQQGTVPFAEIPNTKNPIDAEGILSFNKSFLRSSITIEVIIYLKKGGDAGEEEKHLCNVSGAVLGKLMHYQLFIDGSGSTFPIVTDGDPDKPLWTITYNPDDTVKTLLVRNSGPPIKEVYSKQASERRRL